MIQLHDLVLSYGDSTLFDHISCVFPGDYRIGVVGRNGAGKSTLLKAISSLGNFLDEGSITIARSSRIAYMPQEIVLTSEKSVFDETYSVFAKVLNLQKEQIQLEDLMNQPNVLTQEHLERYAEVQEELMKYDLADCTARTNKMLTGLGFSAEALTKPVAQLSVGWKMRVVLAKLLLEDADFYLFDEPTNHLDIVSKEWFSDFLKNSRFGFLLVTHDRYYLENVCDYIFELERGNGTLFRGNFSSYLKQKEQAAAVKQSAFERQQKEISRKEATINRFRASATKARMAQSMIKQLDKIERIEPDPLLPTVKFSFSAPMRSGQHVLTFKNLSQSFKGNAIFQHISGEVQRGEKVAVIGPNGRGKTTLFNVITGTYPCVSGSIEFGHNVTHAIFEQDQLNALKPSNTVYEEVLNACPGTSEVAIRKFLGAFLFSGDDVHKKISMLSGGERSRVALVKVLLQKANFLILDEPTNHLDLYAKEVLLQALQQYDGTLLLVSHDHDFLQRLATRILELTPQMLYSYPGSYESYLDQKKHLQLVSETTSPAPINRSKSPSQGANTPLGTKETGSLRKELSSLEGKIARLEQKLRDTEELFGRFFYGSPEYDQAVIEREKAQKLLKETMQRWQAILDHFANNGSQ